MILKTLAFAEMHGLGISRRIEQVNNATFRVKPGSLFPAIHRMDEAGWLVAADRRQLHAETRQRESIALAIAGALQAN